MKFKAMTCIESNDSRYKIWTAMRYRCRAEMVYPRHAGRGIRVCERWDYSFKLFCLDMGPRPHGTSIDRIDNDGDYEPDNCRWATDAEQQRNTRKNVFVEHDGKRLCLIEWAEELGITKSAFHHRVRLYGHKNAVLMGRKTNKWSNPLLNTKSADRHERSN